MKILRDEHRNPICFLCKRQSIGSRGSRGSKKSVNGYVVCLECGAKHEAKRRVERLKEKQEELLKKEHSLPLDTHSVISHNTLSNHGSNVSGFEKKDEKSDRDSVDFDVSKEKSNLDGDDVEEVSNSLAIYETFEKEFQELLKGDDQFVVMEYLDNLTVRACDLERLKEGKWFNDTLIDFFLLYTTRESPLSSKSSNYYFFNCSFFALLRRKLQALLKKKKDFEHNNNNSRKKSINTKIEMPKTIKDDDKKKRILEIEESKAESSPKFKGNININADYCKEFYKFCMKVPQNVRISEKATIFIPINYNCHWKLLIIKNFDKVNVNLKKKWDPSCPAMLVFDSLGGPAESCGILEKIRFFLEIRYRIEKSILKENTPRIISKESLPSFQCLVPMQDNFHDCGVFVCKYLESFIKNPSDSIPLEAPTWFDPEKDIIEMRNRIKYLIISKRKEEKYLPKISKEKEKKKEEIIEIYDSDDEIIDISQDSDDDIEEINTKNPPKEKNKSISIEKIQNSRKRGRTTEMEEQQRKIKNRKKEEAKEEKKNTEEKEEKEESLLQRAYKMKGLRY